MSTHGLEIWAGPMFLWAGSIGETARRIEDLGFDGMGFADTQIIVRHDGAERSPLWAPEAALLRKR